MSQGSPIQWCDDTSNPVMGCSAPCELRPTPDRVRAVTKDFFQREFPGVEPEALAAVIDEVTVDYNATEIYQLRAAIVEQVVTEFEPRALAKPMVKRLKEEFDRVFICYAISSTCSEVVMPAIRISEPIRDMRPSLKK
jgi:hypothetical protein